jgi:hypothetical protein
MTAPREIPILFRPEMVRAILEGRKTQTRRPVYSKRRIKNGGVPPSAATFLIGHPPPRFTTWSIGVNEYWALTPWHKVKVGDLLWVRETWQTGMGPGGPMICYRATPDYFALDWAWDGPDEGAGPSFNYDRCPCATWGTNLSDLLSGAEGHWRPGIHMPRWASRILLRVTAVKIEPLNTISGLDALSEGVGLSELLDRAALELGFAGSGRARREYREIWEQIHGHGSWEANPEVVALTFERVEP